MHGMRAALVLALLSYAVGTVQAAPATLRFVSYNIQSGSGLDHVYNLSRTAEAINKMAPVIIGLQEVDNYTARHDVDQTTLLSKATNLPNFVFGQMRLFQGGGYGVSVLSSLPFSNTEILHYKKPNGTQTCLDPVEGDFCQGAVAVRLMPAAGVHVWFVTTHLGIGLHNTQQTEEARQLVVWLKTLLPTGEIVLTGDFNSDPTDETMKIIQNSGFLTDSWIACGDGSPGYTFDSGKPFKRIDYLWYSPGVSCVKNAGQIPNTQASDHRPYFVDLSFS